MDAKTREHAKTLNIVHEIVTDPKEVVADVDVIILELLSTQRLNGWSN